MLTERKSQKEIYIKTKTAITLTESSSFDFPDIESIIKYGYLEDVMYMSVAELDKEVKDDE